MSLIGGYPIGMSNSFSIILIIVYHNRATCELGIDLNRSTCSLSNNQRIEIYGGLVGSLAVLGGLRTAFFILLMLNAARIVHNKMFARILRAPVLFFDTNPIGEALSYTQ